MSKFSPLHETLSNPFANDGTGLWRLTKPLRYDSALLQQVVVVYKGFEHDHASVPRVPGMYATFGNRYHRSAIVHDYLCRTGAVPRDIADTVFLEAMRAENAEELAQITDEDAKAERSAGLEGRAQLMYAAVALYTQFR